MSQSHWLKPELAESNVAFSLLEAYFVISDIEKMSEPPIEIYSIAVGKTFTLQLSVPVSSRSLLLNFAGREKYPGQGFPTSSFYANDQDYKEIWVPHFQAR